MPPNRDIATIEADFERLFRRMTDAFRAALSPEPVHIRESTLSAVAAAEAVGVLYGWVSRIVPAARRAHPGGPGLRRRGVGADPVDHRAHHRVLVACRHAQ